LERGASAVEFALILPLFLLILFGVIDYGWLLTNQIILTNAVSAGARAAVKAEEDEQSQAFARQAVREAFWIQELKEELVETSIVADDSPKRIEVWVSDLTYRPLTGFLPAALLPQKLTAKAVMVFP
jgi:hypothetical protein